MSSDLTRPSIEYLSSLSKLIIVMHTDSFGGLAAEAGFRLTFGNWIFIYKLLYHRSFLLQDFNLSEGLVMTQCQNSYSQFRLG